ncbi:MAG: polysaccharide deacetylase family protein [Granulosicoccus sp.]|nr:polysaccharide deacetylase family protein [Granulosicoccus sp.]
MCKNQVRAIVSIHDVMPHNLDKIDDCLLQLERNHINSCYLLIVPGFDWDDKTLNRLKHYASEGHRLVAHGWVHRATKIDSLYHRLHSFILSRDVAEHLSLNTEDALALMCRSREWFSHNELPEPEYYVPPAWALGKLTVNDLVKTGFNYVESIRGIIDLQQHQLHTLPLVGFEVDSTIRSTGVFLFNSLNLATSCIFPARALRVAIHPDDFDLLLSKSLHKILADITAVSLDLALPTRQEHLIA